MGRRRISVLRAMQNRGKGGLQKKTGEAGKKERGHQKLGRKRISKKGAREGRVEGT